MLRELLLLLSVTVAISPASADTVQVTLRGGHVHTVSSGGVTIEARDLAPGVSTGEAHFLDAGGFPAQGADDRNVETCFIRGNASDPDWNVDLDGWQDANGPGPDFFLFEAGANDPIQVAPVLAGGVVGQEITLSGYTATGYVLSSGPNEGQEIFAVAFRRDQLLDAQGQPLTPATVLDGLRFESASMDVGAFLVHRPTNLDESDGNGTVSLTGEARVGHVVELVYRGPFAWETDILPNPFLDYRLDVELVGPGGASMTLPGFFDADGVGGEHGHLWKARFRADVAGAWTATARFRVGAGVAASLEVDAGVPGFLDGVSVQIDVQELDPLAEGFMSQGRLVAGEAYLRFSHGSTFVRAGTNSPENLLAFAGFDAVTKGQQTGGVIHSYSPHVGDWEAGDPLFVSRDRGVDSRGLVGAIDYLSKIGLNSATAFVMNLGGDGQDAYPFLGPSPTAFDKTHYDTGRLAQWNTVFEHGARRGIAWSVYLGETETENQEWLDGGALGIERKVFLREMVARFAHLPALFWYTSEESDVPTELVREVAAHLDALDPYDNPIGLHNLANELDEFLDLADEPRFTHVGVQVDPDLASDHVEVLRAAAQAAGREWTVAVVEHTPYQDGVTDQNADEVRRRVLYDALLSGGHVDWYLGYHDLPLGGDLSVEDFRTRETTWRQTAAARRLLERLPFTEMAPEDDLLTAESDTFGGGEVFALPGAVYLVYLPEATSSGVLDLSGAGGVFLQRWFDPRTGEFAFTRTVLGGGPLSLGAPPRDPQEDWVVLLARPASAEVE